ncbi:hypothetical protein [Streptomyces hygroscopicus]|uniref:hypothetical protein n=1 Tax=Streptomyces hygroscopicus TaxID=1912 RepID=UPI00379028AA
MNTAPATARTLADPDTPFAVVDVHRTLRNIERLATRADRLGVTLRPHVKTAKSLDVAALMHGGARCPVTVSTLAEAEAFADGGYTDITYAVGIDPHKLPRVIGREPGTRHPHHPRRHHTARPAIGTRLRILPNHACATAAQHHGYHIIDSARSGAGPAPAIEAFWPRVTGW